MKKVKLGEVLIYEQPTKYLVGSDQYSDNYKTPVLTAGKSFILGYTNEEENIFDDVPVIIFDDFTSANQYVDFPFKVKSSAMKILHCNYEKADIRYIFHQLQKIKVDVDRHKRYWISEFADLEIPLPPMDEQKAIAAQLDKAQELIQYNEQLIEKYDELQQSLFLDMFGDPVVNEKGWEMVKLGVITEVYSGSTPSRKNGDYFNGNIPWIKTGEVNGTIIKDTSEKITEVALRESSCRLYPKGSLIIAMYGQGKTRGQIGMLGIEATTNQACAVLLPTDKMNYTFLMSLLKLSYEDLRELGRGGNQPNLNIGIVKSYSVLSPPLYLQTEFASHIESIELQKEQAKEALAKSKDIFQGLLQEHFSN